MQGPPGGGAVLSPNGKIISRLQKEIFHFLTNSPVQGIAEGLPPDHVMIKVWLQEPDIGYGYCSPFRSCSTLAPAAVNVWPDHVMMELLLHEPNTGYGPSSPP